MKRRLAITCGTDFAITDHVLLLFNEHDTKVALNWELYTPPPVKESDNVGTS